MTNEPTFAALGDAKGDIEVRLSYRIVELFSEGLYTSPNKAVEELVANSFDAGARRVHVVLSSNLHDQDATIAVFDDGEGMDQEGLKRHWLIGISNKRRLAALPRGRQQIGKFGIGKLATYVLSNRLTHISKCGGKYYSTSMDYRTIDKRVDREVEPKAPIKLALRELTEVEAKQAVEPWAGTEAFKRAETILFGERSPEAWTLCIMSSLKPKVHEIKPGTLGWVLRTALPLRPDFSIWLNGQALESSKEGKGLLERWVLGKDLEKLPRPSPKAITTSEDMNVAESSELRFGLDVPGLGRIAGYAEAYKDLLTGKSDEIGRSHGFFVYVYGRLLNVDDGHFGISPDELRHGTFGRFRLVVHMDGLDAGLRSNREAVGEGPLLDTAQDVLRAIFNAVRPTIETHDRDEAPGAKLARMLAASPSSLSRRPIVDLSRSVAEGRCKSRYLLVPEHESEEEREAFFADLEKRAADEAERFVTGISIDFDGSSRDGVAKFHTQSGVLRLNGWHPFVATFHDAFTNKRLGRPLELLAMAEVLTEAHLHAIGISVSRIEAFLLVRDQLLRHLTNESGRQSALSVAQALSEARNSPDGLQDAVCAAFGSLGFDVTPLGQRGEPDGVAAAHLPADDQGRARHYRVSLEAKSKKKPGVAVSAKDVGVATIVQHREKRACEHAIVVGPAFPTSQGEASALGQRIKADRETSSAAGAARTLTLMTVDDLAELVRLRPVKQIGLQQLRGLFQECSLPEESAKWVEAVRRTAMEKPPYGKIVETIEALQKKYRKAAVNYSALRVELSHMVPPVEYETDEDLLELCKGMAQMAPGAMFASATTVELDQSAENVVAAIEVAMQDYPPDEP